MLTEFQCSTIFRSRTGRNENRACESVQPKAVFRTAHRGESPLPYSTSRRSHPQPRSLNCRPKVGKRRSYALYKLGKSFRTIFLARNLFVTLVHEIRCENLGGDFETPAIEHFFEDHSDRRFVIFAKRFSRAARIDAGDDCISARIGIAIERLRRSGAGVRA